MRRYRYGQEAIDARDGKIGKQLPKMHCLCRDKLLAALRAAKAVGKSVLAGGEIRNGVELERVRSICTACDTRHVDSAGRRWCGQPMMIVPGVSCGCLVDLKTRLFTETCPQGKW